MVFVFNPLCVLYNILRKRCPAEIYLVTNPGKHDGAGRWTRRYRLFIPDYDRRTDNSDFPI